MGEEEGAGKGDGVSCLDEEGVDGEGRECMAERKRCDDLAESIAEVMKKSVAVLVWAED